MSTWDINVMLALSVSVLGGLLCLWEDRIILSIPFVMVALTIIGVISVG